MDNRTNRTSKKMSKPDWAPRFLKRLAECGNIAAACRWTGIGRRTFYDRRDADRDFAKAASDALEEATDLLELEARRRAHDGVDKPVVYQGRLCGTWVDSKGEQVAEASPGAMLVPLTVKEYSDTLLIFLLKAHRPSVYRHNAGPAAVNVQVQNTHVELSFEQLCQLPPDELIRLHRQTLGLPPADQNAEGQAG
jgi:hypothetical protein